MPTIEASTLIVHHNGVLLGSRAFSVHNKDSDWDVAIMAADLPEEYKEDVKHEVNRYFTVLPLGNSFLIRRPNLDILVFEDEHDFNGVVNAVHILKKLPTFLLKKKGLRCRLFEECLLDYGFKDEVKFSAAGDIPF